jgi:hypothetical protein
MAVCMPTSAVMPIAIMKMVKMVRNKFVRTDFNAILIFSNTNFIQCNIQIISWITRLKNVNSQLLKMNNNS